LLHAHPFKPLPRAYPPDGGYQVVDVMLVTRLQTPAKNGAKKHK